MSSKGLRRLLLYSAGLLAIVCLSVAYWQATEPERLSRMERRCKGQIRQLYQALDQYVQEHGAFPYSATLPDTVDPYALAELKDPFGGEAPIFFSCPAVQASRHPRKQSDSGYRMFNWPKKQWEIAARLLPGGIERLLPGRVDYLPVLWCADPVHDGGRVVCMIYAGGLTLAECTPDMVCGYLKDADFQERMQQLARALRELPCGP